jgi:hypothetical protein
MGREANFKRMNRRGYKFYEGVRRRKAGKYHQRLFWLFAEKE